MHSAERRPTLHRRPPPFHMTDDVSHNPLSQQIGRAKRCYILLSHVLGRNTPSTRPPLRTQLEQAIAAVVREGLYAPFHIKTLKKITGTTNFDTCALSFLELLIKHAEDLLAGRSVVLVIDHLSTLEQTSHKEVECLLNTLTQKGFKVLIKYDSEHLVYWKSKSLIQKKLPM
jgi:hypothetical protein